MASPPPPPPGPPATWSVSVFLRHRCGLEIRAAAENVLPGWWGRGGERLSLLLRLRRRLLLSVTSHCGDRPAHPAPQPPRGCGVVLRFLRGRWARVASVWRRRGKKQPPARVAAAAAVPRGRLAQRDQTPARPGFLAMACTPKSAATLRFVVAALAVAVASVAVLHLAVRIGCWNGTGGRDPEPVARWAKFLELMEHPPLQYKYKRLLGIGSAELFATFTNRALQRAAQRRRRHAVPWMRNQSKLIPNDLVVRIEDKYATRYLNKNKAVVDGELRVILFKEENSGEDQSDPTRFTDLDSNSISRGNITTLEFKILILLPGAIVYAMPQ
ncbi:hypothetical protein U9M48_020882 [Paspalum notatum var. saurae]|uniref:Uncharacterized protein n=1 Tax=Paspalum notatum var. saurae TaxID=547442 RepID=A0AAQ3WSG4_PASNO